MEAVAVIAGVVGLVWGVVALRRGGLLAGCLAVLLAGACFGQPFFKIDAGPAPLTIDRLLLVLLVAQYVVWRRLGYADPKPLGKPEILLLLFLGVLAVSTLSHDWQAFNYRAVSWLTIFYLMPAVLYWIARQMKFSEREALTTFGCLALFGVYLAVTSLAELNQAWWLVFPKYIETTTTDPAVGFVGRGRGPLLQPIGNGILLAVCFGGALMWWPRWRRPGKLALLAASALFGAAIYGSLTRSVWMGGALTLALAVGAVLPRRWRLPTLGAGLLIGATVAALQWENLMAFKRDRGQSAREAAESVELRPILTTISWRMFADRPLLGCGYAQHESEQPQYLFDRTIELPLERGRGYVPHNTVFLLLVETGLVGTGLFLAVVFFLDPRRCGVVP